MYPLGFLLTALKRIAIFFPLSYKNVEIVLTLISVGVTTHNVCRHPLTLCTHTLVYFVRIEIDFLPHPPRKTEE